MLEMFHVEIARGRKFLRGTAIYQPIMGTIIKNAVSANQRAGSDDGGDHRYAGRSSLYEQSILRSASR